MLWQQRMVGSPRSSPRSRVFRALGVQRNFLMNIHNWHNGRARRETDAFEVPENAESAGEEAEEKDPGGVVVGVVEGGVPLIRSERLVTARVTLPSPLPHPSACHAAPLSRSVRTHRGHTG